MKSFEKFIKENKVIQQSLLTKITGGRETFKTETPDYTDKVIVRNNGTHIWRQWPKHLTEPTDADDQYQL